MSDSMSTMLTDYPDSVVVKLRPPVFPCGWSRLYDAVFHPIAGLVWAIYVIVSAINYKLAHLNWLPRVWWQILLIIAIPPCIAAFVNDRRVMREWRTAEFYPQTSALIENLRTAVYPVKGFQYSSISTAGYKVTYLANGRIRHYHGVDNSDRIPHRLTPELIVFPTVKLSPSGRTGLFPRALAAGDKLRRPMIYYAGEPLLLHHAEQIP